MKAIEARNIGKKFDYYKKEEGLRHSLRNLFYREKLEKSALEDINFDIEKGEIVGLLGPNGAGKTTTIKLLSGIIYPTSGSMNVIGYTPWDRKNDFKKKIAVIMAQKNQLWWDLPANESILLNSYIYGLTREEYKKSLDELVGIFGVKDLLPVQVRRLSLGERMKFEIISSLIYKPEVIFLDEPTIGLDIIAQREMRRFIKSYQEEYHATVVLTSHYMQDIEALCKRTIIINNGKKVYDGLLSEINNVDYKILSFYANEQDLPMECFERWGKIKRENDKIDIEIPKDRLKECLQYLLSNNIMDFSVEDMPIEDNVISMYEKA